MGEAAERWYSLVDARLAEVQRLAPDGVGLGPGFWDSRAARYSRSVTPAVRDPFLGHVRRRVGPRTTVLDVGSGPGRFALALAPRAAWVTAVDPSRRMLAILSRAAAEHGLGNVTTVRGAWDDVAVDPADVVICSFVLPVIADGSAFVAKLHAMARRRVVLYMAAWCTDAVVDPFWRHFHGAPRSTPPSYLDAADLVEEVVGSRPRVRVVEIPTRGRYRDLAEAVEDYRDWLLLPPTSAVRRELAELLTPWLATSGGVLRPPLRTQPAAILEWEPGPGNRP